MTKKKKDPHELSSCCCLSIFFIYYYHFEIRFLFFEATRARAGVGGVFFSSMSL